MIWSDEARSVLAEDRRRENYELELWDDERRDAFDRDFSEEDHYWDWVNRVEDPA